MDLSGQGDSAGTPHRLLLEKRSVGRPSPRAQCGANKYGTLMIDLDGYNIEAVCRDCLVEDVPGQGSRLLGVFSLEIGILHQPVFDHLPFETPLIADFKGR
jgi:hypothetical protein